MLPEHKQILVVDDEPNLRRVLSAQLERDGYDVHTAEDGEQALVVLKEHHLDLIITDLRMTKLAGMELLRRAVAIDYLPKSVDPAEVRAIVRKALRTRALSAAEATRPESDARESARYGII